MTRSGYDGDISFERRSPLVPFHLPGLSVSPGKRNFIATFLALPILLLVGSCTDITGPPFDMTAPTIASVSPTNNSTGASIGTTITAKFSEPVVHSSVNRNTFTINGVSGSVRAFANTATFTPDAALSPATRYTATITTGVLDITGNRLTQNFTWSFTTE